MAGKGCGCQAGGKSSSRKTMRKRPSSAAKKLYRKRVKGSKCRGMKTAKCRSSKSCKMALGKKRSFCRKAGNTKRPRYNLRSRKTKKGGFKPFGHKYKHLPKYKSGDLKLAKKISKTTSPSIGTGGLTLY